VVEHGPEVEIVVRGGHPDFLDLPWDAPLASWQHERLVPMAHGISRHVVRFVRYDHRVYAIKETQRDIAEAEHRALRQLLDAGLPVVVPVGLVRSRDAGEVAALITRYLDFSLPYWYVIGREAPTPTDVLLDAAVVLLVRLHLAGVFWGDCSPSNILFRRDAGAMMAYLVDAETVEVHPRISDQMRTHDLDVAFENLVGSVFDLQAAGRVDADVNPVALAEDLVRRYEGLWEELTRADRFDRAERWRIDARVRRINELGFDVEELAIRSVEGGQVLDIRPTLVEEGHHFRALRQRTGLEVQENQARRLLADIENFRARLEQDEGRPVPDAVGAARWLGEVYEPIIGAVPAELANRLEPAEIFHELLEHRHEMAETAGREITNEEALADYVASVLPERPGERQILR
jgi:tRNA A-37 threonylcarbamoyl transferase component Bud32